MQHFIKEFKAFAVRGNVVDLAIAVIIGGAFGKIVSSLVDTMVMPLLGIFLGGVDFSGFSFSLGDVVLRYGVFMQSVIDFVIIAFVIFLAIKILNRIQHKEDSVIEEQKPPSEEVQLLREIRDLLQKR